MEKIANLFIEELETRQATSPIIVYDGAPDPNAQAYLNANEHAKFLVPQITTLACGEELFSGC
jgi:hypothetical protein